MIERRVRRRGFGQPREQSRFSERQLADRLAEEGSRRSLDAEGAMAEVNLVQIELEDTVLGIATLEQDCEHCLFELALEALVRRQEEHLGQLLGDRASAF